MEAGEVEELWSEVMGRYETGVEKLVVDTLQESRYILLIHSNYAMDINYEAVIACFYALHPCRVSMEDMLKN